MPKEYYIETYYPSCNFKLHTAAYSGELEDLKKLLSTSGCLYLYGFKNSALFLALAQNHQDIINELLPLYENDLKVVNTFLQDEDALQKNTSVLVAFGTKQIDTINALSKKQKGKTISNPSKITVLLKEDNYGQSKILQFNMEHEQDAFKIADELIANGTLDLNRKMQSGDTLLHIAALNGMTDLVFKLIDLGAKHDIRNKDKFTPFCYAIMNGKMETIKEMMKRLDIDILEAVSDIQKSYADVAAMSDEYEVFLFLVEEMVNQRQKRFGETRELSLTNIVNNPDVYFENLEFGEQVLKDFVIDHSLLTVPTCTLLHRCIYCDVNKDIARRLVDFDYNMLNVENVERDVEGCTPLHIMVFQGWSDVVIELYEKYPESKDILFNKPEVGCFSLKQGLISRYLSVDGAISLITTHKTELIKYKFVPKIIIEAARYSKYIDVLKHLVVYLDDEDDVTDALFIALEYKIFESFYYLFESGKCKNLKNGVDEDGYNLLYWTIHVVPRSRPGIFRCGMRILTKEEEDAIHLKEQNSLDQIFDILVENGVDMNHLNEKKQSLVHKAASAGNLKILQKLLASGVPPNNPDCNEIYPIHRTLNVDVLKELVNNTSEDIVNIKDKDGNTVVHHSVQDYDCKVNFLEELIRLNCDVNAKNNAGQTPLFHVVNSECASYLLENGANPNIKDNCGDTPVHAAIAQDRSAAEILITRPETDVSTFNNKISYLPFFINEYYETHSLLKTEVLDKLFADGCNTFDANGDSVLLLACKKNDELSLTKLMKQSNINLNIKGSSGLVPLHVAINHPVFLKRFIDKNADLNAKDIDNKTPLIYCLESNDDEAARILLVAGADVNSQDINGDTVAHFAARNTNVHMLYELMTFGADFSIVNRKNEKCLDLIEENCITVYNL